MAYGKKEFHFPTHPMGSFLFFDIETVARVEELEEDSDLYKSFYYKMRYTEEAQRKDFSAYNLKALYDQKAALYPEFGKIVCISVGRVIDGEAVIYSFKGTDEKNLLERFNQSLTRWAQEDPNLALCGVNTKFFDLRYIYIRSVVNGIKPVQKHIDLYGLKPWEVWTCDITDIWKQTSPYNAPLMCITEVLGLPSPKQDIDGSQVSEVYYKEGEEGLNRIATYCEEDVMAVIRIACKLRFEPLIPRKGEAPVTPAVTEEMAEAVTEEVTELDVKKDLNVFQRIYHTNDLDSNLEAEVLSLVKGKRLTKGDKENLQTILEGALLRTDFINGDKDSKDVEEDKRLKIHELMQKINGKGKASTTDSNK